MIDWLNTFKHLLPNARAWQITAEKNLRRFFDGLTGLGVDTKDYLDSIYDDLDPQKTRELSAWESQFALPAVSLTEQQRRDRLEGAWKTNGGQSPRYIQDTLQAAGFDVYVHEWWVPSVEHPAGGSVNGDVTPVVRNPFDYLWDGTSERKILGSGHDDMYAGGDAAFANSQVDPPGYPLVNKLTVPELTIAGPPYVIPNDPTKFPYFLYIGGETFPETSTVQANRQNEFEDLCLKICPTEQWLGILVNYS